MKRGRPSKKALAERERRARARFKRLLEESRAREEELFKAAQLAVARQAEGDAVWARDQLQKAAYGYTRANDAAGEAFI